MLDFEKEIKQIVMDQMKQYLEDNKKIDDSKDKENCLLEVIIRFIYTQSFILLYFY